MINEKAPEYHNAKILAGMDAAIQETGRRLRATEKILAMLSDAHTETIKNRIEAAANAQDYPAQADAANYISATTWTAYQAAATERRELSDTLRRLTGRRAIMQKTLDQQTANGSHDEQHQAECNYSAAVAGIIYDMIDAYHHDRSPHHLRAAQAAHAANRQRMLSPWENETDAAIKAAWKDYHARTA